jgi:hypothetical protein
MHVLIAALHGILTNQTDPSWPDKFDAWMYHRDPEVKVLKKKYRAGPFPRWNCWFKDPFLARSLANEIELFLNQPIECQSPSESSSRTTHEPRTLSGHVSDSEHTPPPNRAVSNPTPALSRPPVWFVAHSNGAVIALLTAKRLIAHGYQVGGLILTGAACEADVAKNGVLEWWSDGVLGNAIAYSSVDDHVLPGRGIYRLLAWPYGSLGRTGWLLDGKPVDEWPGQIFTRWFPGGHSTYFSPQNIENTFEQICEDIESSSSSFLHGNVCTSESGGMRRTPNASRQRTRLEPGEAFGVRRIPALLHRQSRSGANRKCSHAHASSPINTGL